MTNYEHLFQLCIRQPAFVEELCYFWLLKYSLLISECNYMYK